jgi:hypothetical protein
MRVGKRVGKFVKALGEMGWRQNEDAGKGILNTFQTSGTVEICLGIGIGRSGVV